MPKYINKSQVVGEKGVAAFHDYCANHNPPILWREETKNDFGIDGEIEIIRRNENGKLEVTGEILKIQLKSTETGSYITNETETSFDFVATKDDIIYWKNHKLSVLLVVYFTKHKKLFAKKVDTYDLEKSQKRMPVIFNKKSDLLDKDNFQFLEKFSEHFRGRINFDTTEKLYSNVFKFSCLPKFIYQYESKVSDIRKIFDSELEYPELILHSSKIYTFSNLGHYPEFIKEFVESPNNKSISFKTFLLSLETRKYAIELLNKYFKQHCFQKGIGYNKDYRRYFFKKFKKDPISKTEKTSFLKEVYRLEKYIPKSRTKKSIKREVVTRYNYYEKTDFIRHFSFEIGYFVDMSTLYISITPKYLFTTNGKDVLENKKKITQYTNYLTSREFNQQVLNHIYFIFQYLSDNRNNIELSNYENNTISISRMETFNVPFGIDYQLFENENNENKKSDATQTLLFDL